jgi:hypothetical protein
MGPPNSIAAMRRQRCSGCGIAGGTTKPLPDFAREVLIDPLDVWANGVVSRAAKLFVRRRAGGA